MRLDLHVHTNRSDGSKSFEEVTYEAKGIGMEVIAITDHDVINSITSSNGLKVITGVELSAIHNNGLFHVLGYHVDPNNDQLKKIVNKNLVAEVKNNYLKDDMFMTEFAKKYHFNRESYDSFNETARPVAGQQFISKAQQYLISKGYCKDRKDFFKRILPELFPNGIKFDLPEFISSIDAITAIKQAGGIAILAHPFKRSQRLSLNDSLRLFTDLGIDGYECFHPEADKYITQACLKWCRDNNKYITGGSDYHGGRLSRKLSLLSNNEDYINLPLI